MKGFKPKIVADGPQCLRDANDYHAMRKRLQVEVALHHESELKTARWWRRLWINLKIRREVGAKLSRRFPTAALHIAANLE